MESVDHSSAVDNLELSTLLLIAGHVSMPLISGMYDLNNFILMGARLPQIAKNFAAKSTGQLSIITYAANTLGCIARLFTTVQEGGGSAMLRSYMLSKCGDEQQCIQ